jgi:hypothetical protein
MQHKALVACAAAALLAAGLACSKDSETPTSPGSTQPGNSQAGPNGETLKASAPTPVSPVNNAQPDSLVLVANKATALFNPASAGAYQYEFEIRRGGNAVSGCTQTVGGGSGNTVSFTPACTLEFEQAYSWRVRAVYQQRQGPWSNEGTFRAPAGGYINGNEVMDPLTNGRSAGELSGPVEFVSGQGARLGSFNSFITYRLQQNLQAGEVSMMVLGADEGNDGDKTKIFSMQEGPDINDITDDDYRMTAELRGRRYSNPGAVTFRFKINEVVEDGARIQLNFNSSRWYFWRFTWVPGSGRLEVKEDGPNGRTIYDAGAPMHGRTYRPDPHFVHIGVPQGRAGAQDATHPGMIVKNVWVSSRPRPAFPGE